MRDGKMLNKEIDMSFNYEAVTYGEIKDGQGAEATEKMKPLLIEAKLTENDCCAAWNRLYNKGHKKRMFFSSVLCHDWKVMPTLVAGHCDAYDYSNKKSISKMDMIHSQTFPEDFNFINDNFSKVSFVCGMSVAPVMMKRFVERLIEVGVYDVKERD